jgi:transposase-like protein
MEKNSKRKLAAGAAAALAVAGGGAAVAATKHSSPKEESQAVVNNAAQQLGIEPSKLSSALKQALEDRVDAAVTAGRLTKEEGDSMKARIESGELPLFFAGGDHRRFDHHGPKLDAAATYLGLTEAQIRTELESGKTLAQIATTHGKTVDGLVQALYDAQKKELDAGVSAGRLTQAQEDSILANLKQRITGLVNGTPPPRGGGLRGFRSFRGGGQGGPPPAWGRPAA